jgi:hypothetical protein
LAALQILGLGLLLVLSVWVSLDARKRGMSTRWGIGVFLALIIFLPIYFVVRKPLPAVKCTGCGKKVDMTREFCWGCGEPIAQAAAAGGGADEGRPGRMLG